jgi:serine/threonine protein kinase
MNVLINKTINNYKLVKLLGEGGYGSVYKVENINNKKEYNLFYRL